MASNNNATVPNHLWTTNTSAPPHLRDVLSQLAHFFDRLGYTKTYKALLAESQKKGGIPLDIAEWEECLGDGDGSAATLMKLWELHREQRNTFPTMTPDMHTSNEEESSSDEESDEDRDSDDDDDETEGKKAGAVDDEAESTSDDSSDEDSSNEEDAERGTKRKRELTPSSGEDESSEGDSSSEGGSDDESSSEDERPAKRTKVDSSDEDSSSDDSSSASQTGGVNVQEDSSSDDSSDSDSSDGSSRDSDSSDSDSDNDNDSSSSESDSDDSESSASPPPKKKAKATPAKEDKKEADDSGASTSSATLPASPAKSSKKSKTAKAAPASASAPSTSAGTTAPEDDLLVPAGALAEPSSENSGMHPDRLARLPASKETTMKRIPASQEIVKNLKKQNVPFSRIPADTKVDPKFASNEYVSYDYADRAYQDLVVTKGKGFTKEKNKKKRGSYRGGAIDLTPKGIKFED